MDTKGQYILKLNLVSQLIEDSHSISVVFKILGNSVDDCSTMSIAFNVHQGSGLTVVHALQYTMLNCTQTSVDLSCLQTSMLILAYMSS